MRWKIDGSEILVYPTDTIYGVGCDATNQELIEKLRRMKKRPEKPLSIIAPSKQWIYQNCYISRQTQHFLKKLPGPYTLILPLRKNVDVAPSVTKKYDTLGIRIPNHWIAESVKKYGKPFITTSLNITGQPHCKRPENMPETLRSYVTTCINQGFLDNGPSIIYDCTGVSPKRIR